MCCPTEAERLRLLFRTFETGFVDFVRVKRSYNIHESIDGERKLAGFYRRVCAHVAVGSSPLPGPARER
jgi:hypothetical protein